MSELRTEPRCGRCGHVLVSGESISLDLKRCTIEGCECKSCVRVTPESAPQPVVWVSSMSPALMRMLNAGEQAGLKYST
jgi:hypothetical protein